MSRTTVDALTDRMRPVVTDAVDVLHVAAALESSGVTDDLARSQYGHDDVFALAGTLRERTQGAPSTAPADGGPAPRPPHPGTRPLVPLRRPRRRWSRPGTEISHVGHGVIYLLPALSIPALLELVGPRHAVTALVVGGAVGWAWAVVATWWAYAVLGGTGEDAAQASLRRSTLAGVLVGLAAALTLVALGGTPPVVGVVAATVTAAQLGTTLMFFQRRRRLLVAVLAAPALAGLAHLLAPEVVPALPVLLVVVLATLALLVVGRAGRGPAAGGLPVRPRAALPVLWYAVASVAFLLLPQAAFLGRGGGLPLALAGLFLVMGLVEWRSWVLSHRLRRLLRQSTSITGFRSRTAGLALLEVLACALAAALAAALVLWLLGRAGLAAGPVLLVAASTVPLAAAYLLALVLANTGAYTWLAASFSVGALTELLLPALDLVRSTAGSLLVASGVLLVALLVGLLRRPVQRFR